LVSRLFENVSFGLSGGVAMAMLRRPDVIYANTWPIFASGIAALVALFRGIPIVVSVQDVYPESLFSLGRLRKESILARLLRFVDVRITHFASDVVVISQRMERIYLGDRGIPAERLHLIANWRGSEEPPDAEAVRLRRDGWGISPGTFLFIFAGNVAAACGIDGAIEAISALPAEPFAQLLVAGSGSALENCRNVASRQGYDRTVFRGAFSAQETLPILSAADVLILPTQGDQSLVAMPSKLISYMLAARPVLAVARPESDLAKVVIESGCGWVVEPGDTGQLARQMSVAAAMDRSVLTRMGSLGREYALAHFSTEACMPKVIGVLEKAMRAKRPNSTAPETHLGQRA
jgi:glycosyltransferase involved in cell wall biosynthesis